ncbi:glycosyl hydrolase family 3 N terminal domain-containing protein [Ilyonectria sp. MPI-CAGE-AT-0026]|nr:glycosyl hydrolase family 3 N terminal domain-containing protein [Ilyonectria sp. MPI-CAGE-AT-0026]
MRFRDTWALVATAVLLQLDSAAASSPGSPLSWKAASEKASRFVSQLDTSEKVGLVSGGYLSKSLACVGAIGAIERLGFEGICFSDGPSGYARSDGVSVFPSGITVAATWDRQLMYQRAVAIGTEFRDKGSHVHLGPSSGPIGRHALGGRNWESFGPDPYLAGIAMGASVSGIQSVGVQACSKHYIGNEQETQRTQTTQDDGTVIEAISANIDDRTLHELYLWPFANAVQAGTATVMCSYNRVNGTYSCANPDTLSILKDELAFPGYVVSDWYATHGTADFANAGLDVEMPGNVSALAGPAYFGELLLEAVNNGTVSKTRLNNMAERVLTPYFALRQDKNFPSLDPANGAAMLTYQYGHGSSLAAYYPEVPARDVRRDHAKLIRKVGAAGTVLLKNLNGTLPLTGEKQFGVFGNDASYPTIGSVFLSSQTEGFEMGTVDIGGGSGTVRHTKLVTPLEAIQKRVDALGGRVQVLLDNNEITDGRFRTIYPTPEVCLVFLKAYAGEGHDRQSIDLEWNATAVVESTASICTNTIVVVHAPGVISMPWADNENVTAILLAHYPGEQSGNSIVDLLWGDVEPSGRLPYSIPKKQSDYGPAIVNLTSSDISPDAWNADFNEGQMIDYRHFDAEGIDPAYEFGFGLSYTKFQMGRDLQIKVKSGVSSLADKSKGIAPGGLKDLWATVANVTVEISNVGSSAGYAVPQLYISFPKDTTPEHTPMKVLRGFEKVYLKRGEKKKVSFELMRRDLSFWAATEKRWVIPDGKFTFRAGFSSKLLMVEAKATILK